MLRQFLNSKAAVSILLAGTMTVVASGCGNSKGGKIDSRFVDTASIAADPVMSEQEKAEELAQAAERLLTPTSFMYTYAVAKSALAVDPKNTRARLWAAVLAPTMELRGILTRIEPLVKTHPAHYAEYKRFVADIKSKNPEKSITEFLFAGPADIKTESDAQEVLARVAARHDELRRTFNDLKNEEISIYVNDENFKKNAMLEAAKACPVVKVSETRYELGDCDYSQAYERKLNRADFEMLQQITAGIQTYLTIVNAWDLSGLYLKSSKLNKKFGVKANVEYLLRNKQFGTLRQKHALGVIPDLAKDAVLGARYAIEMQDSLCPNGVETPANRPGHLFADGLCIHNGDSVKSMLAAIELMLSGTPAVIVGERGGKPTTTVVNGTKFFTTPIADLRSQLPLEEDSCGNLTKLGDGTLGGTFPTGDLNVFLAEDAARNWCWPSYGNN
jgi:hypothetical protein